MTASPPPDTPADPLVIAGERLASRLFIGTGRYRRAADLVDAVRAARPSLIAVAIRRVALDAPEAAEPDPVAALLDADLVGPEGARLLPNTSGARDAAEAVRIARLAREVVGHGWVKLEITPDETTLLPDPIETLAAAGTLVADGFTVLPYMPADPVLAKRLEDAGCAAVMPLGAPIGTGQGITTRRFVELIVRDASVPVVVDAGLGAPSHACDAMELGADAVLANTAIARAADPVAMARAFAGAVVAGRTARIAGRIPESPTPTASSSLEGRIGHG